MSLIKCQSKRYYRWVGGQKRGKMHYVICEWPLDKKRASVFIRSPQEVIPRFLSHPIFARILFGFPAKTARARVVSETGNLVSTIENVIMRSE